MKIFSLLTLFVATAAYAMPMQSQRNVASVLQELKEHRVAFVNFIFTDILGGIKEITVPLQHAHNACAEGLAFDGSSVPGCTTITASDMLLVPDLNTTRIIPWLDGMHKTALIICDIYRDENTPFEGDARSTLKRIVQEAYDADYELFVGPELEFFLFMPDGKPIDAYAYVDAETNIAGQTFRTTLLQMLSNIGVNVEKLHHEVATGQYEISLRYGSPVELADQLMLAKYAIKAIAQSYNCTANFMPKPISGQNGSAMHIHFSLWDTEQRRNLFYDAAHPEGLSYRGQQFVAGVLNHINELCLLFNPTINSFKRLVPGYEAPTYICWGKKNRSALIRLPQTSGAHSKRTELRNPDPLCNPYLAFAALLASGMQGIKNDYDPTVEVEDNLYKLSAAERSARGIQGLPGCLSHAIALFEHSSIAHELLTAPVVHALVALKRKEAAAYQSFISQWEIERYR
jgi:glutamine synthetase